jgi:hypothetical protein
VLSQNWQTRTNPPSGNYHWITEWLGAFSIAQPPTRRDHFLWLGVDIIEFASGWFILALEDYHQFEWVLELIDGEWAEVAEWRAKFLRFPLRHIEPRSLCLVFESAGYPMYITLNYRRDNRLDHPYGLLFEDDLSVMASVSLICRSSFAGLTSPSQETLCELCAKAGLYRCMKGKRASKKALDKCPVCIRAQQVCNPSSKTRELPIIGSSHIPNELRLIPQQDHRYRFFQLCDPRYQVEQAIEDALHGAKVSSSVPLVGYDPRNNHWRPLPLRETDGDYTLDESQFLPPPDNFPPEELGRYGILPEGPVRPYKINAPRTSPVAGPSKSKTTAKGSLKRKAARVATPETSEEVNRPAKHRHTVPAPPPPRVGQVPREDILEGLPTTHWSLLLPVSPAVLLSEFQTPIALPEHQRDLVNGVVRELVAISGTLSSVAASWNTLISDLQCLGQRFKFDGNLPGVFMHGQPAVDWEETPVDPSDRKGKKPAWCKKGKPRRGDNSALESDPAPDSEEEPREDPDRGGPADGGSGEGGAMVEG